MARKPKKTTVPEGGRTAWRPRGVLAVILVVAALLRFVPLGVREPRFHHLDEWDFALSAQRMLAEGDLNPHRFHHPALYRYAIAVVYPVANVALGPFMAPEARRWMPYLAGRLISAALGVVGVWLVFRLGMRLMGLGGAALAAAVLALMPLHVKFGHIAKPDTTMAMWVALTTLLAWRIAEKPSRRLYVLAGLCVGLATGSKYNGLVACVPVFVAHMMAPGTRQWYRRLVAADLWLAGLCSVGAFLITSPYHVLDYTSMLEEFGTGYAFVVTGDPAEVVERPPALAVFGRDSLLWIGAVPLGLMLAGAVVWWRANRRALLVVGSIIVAYVAAVSGLALPQVHYLMPIVPAVATLAAVPLVALWPRRRRLGVALAVAALAPGAAVSVREVVRFWRPDTKTLASDWLRGHLRGPHGWVLRDYDALWDTAGEVLPVKNPGFEFYEVAGRAHLKEHGVTHFVLSDGVAAMEGMQPERKRRRMARRHELLACGELLTRIEPGWWREGPGIEIYQVKVRLLRAFADERERAARDLTAKVAAAEHELARKPNDLTLHLEAGRLLYDLGGVASGQQAFDAYRRAEAHFVHAASLDPACADACYDRGCVLLQLGAMLTRQRETQERAVASLREAEAALRKALELDPRQADYYFNLGYVLMGRPSTDPDATQQESRRLFDKAKELNPAIGGIERGPRSLH